VQRGGSGRLFFAAVPLAAVLLVAVTVTQAVAVRNNLLLARTRFTEAEHAADNGDVDTATRSVESARARTRSASATLSGPAFDALAAVPFVGDDVRAVRSIVGAVDDASAATDDVLRALSRLDVPKEDGNDDGIDLASAVESAAALRPTIERSLVSLAAARRAASDASMRFLRVGSARADLVAAIDRVTEQAGTALDLLALGEHFVGRGTATRLLVLGQDTFELRPSGGFIGSYGVLEIRDGTLRLVTYQDSTTMPGTSLEPPPTLRAAMPGLWRLTGAGWWTDFPQTAVTAQRMFAETNGETVDGVVALTDRAIADLLDVIGPVTVPSFGETVTAANVSERILWHVELKRPQDKPRKRFLTELADTVFSKLASVRGDAAVAFLRTVATASARRDAQVWFADAATQRLVSNANLDGTLVRVPAGSDFLSVVDANMGIDKANRDVRTSIAYRVTRERSGRLVGEVRVTTANPGPKSNVNVRYDSFVRVYVPKGSQLVDRSTQPAAVVGEDAGYQTFGLAGFVPVGETITRTFRYRLPASVSADAYRLTFQPQAGTSGPVSVRVPGASRVFDAADGLQRVG
jgi:hypothetical protein